MVTTAELRTTISNMEYMCSAVIPLAYNSEPLLFICCFQMRQLLINEEVPIDRDEANTCTIYVSSMVRQVSNVGSSL
jgi:hypothetical protein